jgi:hypothetical protein
LHTNFRLSGDGERVTIAEPGGCIADRVDYPPLSGDEAFGFNALGERVVIAAPSGAPESAPEPSGVPSCAADGAVVIGALQGNNDTTRLDEDGDDGDWVQLLNTTDKAVDLTGWILADDSARWTVPDGVTIAADGTLLIWADDKDRGSASAPLHANFKIANEGETVTLSAADGCLQDSVTLPEIEADQIWQRGADGLFAVAGGSSGEADQSDDVKTEASGGGDAAAEISVTGTCVAINEIMAKNASTIEDDAGELGDWIELANIGDETIDLSGWVIGDEADEWTIPDGVEIEAGGFLLLWADGGDAGEAGAELHTNFKLGSSGEPLTLVTADGDTAASMSSYPELGDDESFGVDDNGDYVVFGELEATPGAGPVMADGCDFDVAVAAAAGAAASDSDAADSAGGSDSADEGAATDDALARTGTDTGTRTLLAQLLLLTGASLLVMAKIAERRSLLEPHP